MFNTDSGTLLNQEIIFTSTIDYLGTRYNGSAIQNITLCHQHGCWKHSILFTSHLDVQLRNICHGDKASNYAQTILFYIILLHFLHVLSILSASPCRNADWIPQRDNLGDGSIKEWTRLKLVFLEKMGLWFGMDSSGSRHFALQLRISHSSLSSTKTTF
jgi:hypothetical protein